MRVDTTRFSESFTSASPHLPVKRVAEMIRLQRRGFVLRIPKRDDVVQPFVSRVQFHQMQIAVAPIAMRLNPYAGHPLVKVETVLIRGKVTLALEQAKTSDVRRVKNLVAHDGRIVERTPERFAVAHVHEQAVAVVDFGTVIVELALGSFCQTKTCSSSGARPMVLIGCAFVIGGVDFCLSRGNTTPRPRRQLSFRRGGCQIHTRRRN